MSMPPSRKEIDLPAIQRHFAARTRAVLLAPYERLHRLRRADPLRPALRGDPGRLAEDRRRGGRRAVTDRRPARRRTGREAGSVLASASAAAGSQSRRNWAQRAASSASPIASAARDEHVEAAQEAPVRLVRPRHRAVALPAVAAQLVQAAVVAGAGVRVRRDGLARRPARAPRAPPRRALEVGKSRRDLGVRLVGVGLPRRLASAATASSFAGRRVAGGSGKRFCIAPIQPATGAGHSLNG